MADDAELQRTELFALRSIFGDDFIECPPPSVWKGAARLVEFIIKVSHPDPEHAPKVHANLHTRFPKTYPTHASPQFTIQQPTQGLSPALLTKLNSAVHAEAQRTRGSEAVVFEIVTFVQEWIEKNATPQKETTGSLATEMNKRAEDLERAKREEEEARATYELERAAREAASVKAQILAQQQAAQAEREASHKAKARKRGLSDATAVPSEASAAADTPTEYFSQLVDVDGVRFSGVRLFHPRKECLGTTYAAEPICDDTLPSPPLELQAVAFDTPYYSTGQGRKKLRHLESELRKLIGVRNEHVQRVYAAKLVTPNAAGPSRLAVLAEVGPKMTLLDLVEDCGGVPEARAYTYVVQILQGLQAIHSAGLVHRGIGLKTVGLVSPSNGQGPKNAKLWKSTHYIGLLDLHRSNPIGARVPPIPEESEVPEEWLPSEIVESPLVYSKARDIHDVGLVLLQMIHGKEAFLRWPDMNTYFEDSNRSPSFHKVMYKMFGLSKKNGVNCASLLAELSRTMVLPPTTRVMSPVIPHATSDPKSPLAQQFGSPEKDYFLGSMAALTRQRQNRWKTEWEELEILGRGGFGSVVKARNKIDGNIYAVKKIRLRPGQNDAKILREVQALSKLQHRYIVRYSTTWFSEQATSDHVPGSDDSESSGRTTLPAHADTFGFERSNPLTMSYENRSASGSQSTSSFPTILFADPGSEPIESGDEDEETEEEASEGNSAGSDGQKTDSSDELFALSPPRSPDTSESSDSGSDSGQDASDEGEESIVQFKAPAVRVNGVSPVRGGMFVPQLPGRTLHIAMEFVERQTLREAIAEGLSEAHAWRLFSQILDALAYMEKSQILHRDIKLTNIFIDGEGNCKVGDFGLATSSLRAVDPSDVSPQSIVLDAEMTLEVGTRLYIAPEVLSRNRGRDHSKADIYSLGIVFFEMNYPFSTASERVVVIERLRKADITFPRDWELRRDRQRQIIKLMLQHDTKLRPSAQDLLQSPLIPSSNEDERVKSAIPLLVKPESQHFNTLLDALFSRPPQLARSYLYDAEMDLPEHANLDGIVASTLSDIFRLHGAIDAEPALLMPRMAAEDDRNRAVMLDKHGEVVSLPTNALVPFARLAARAGHKRIKRYHIGDVYRNSAPGHPRAFKAACFDIITPDTIDGPAVALAETISVINECLDSFPGLSAHYEIHISHSRIIDFAMNRIPAEIRAAVLAILTQTRASPSQKRALLLNKGLPRSKLDELEVLSEADADLEVIWSKYERMFPDGAASLKTAVEDIRSVLHYTALSGVTRPITFHPLMLSSHVHYFKDGVCFEVIKRGKKAEFLAAGGRYDRLISSFTPPNPDAEFTYAAVVQLSLEQIATELAAYQNASVKSLIKEQRSFGFWTPRRCDVYVVSYQSGHLRERLEVAALLWRNGISADIMYESGLAEAESHSALCAEEGILFTVYPRPRTARRDQPAFKVKSVLRGKEYDLSRHELVGWLQEQIAEQKRVDASTSGVSSGTEATHLVNAVKETPAVANNVQLLLPSSAAKKQRGQTRHVFADRAYGLSLDLAQAMNAGIHTLAVDVPGPVFEAMTRNAAWLADSDDSWREVSTSSGVQHAYAQQLRDAAARRRAEGNRFLLLVNVREEKMGLLTLS